MQFIPSPHALLILVHTSSYFNIKIFGGEPEKISFDFLLSCFCLFFNRDRFTDKMSVKLVRPLV